MVQEIGRRAGAKRTHKRLPSLTGVLGVVFAVLIFHHSLEKDGRILRDRDRLQTARELVRFDTLEQKNAPGRAAQQSETYLYCPARTSRGWVRAVVLQKAFSA